MNGILISVKFLFDWSSKSTNEFKLHWKELYIWHTILSTSLNLLKFFKMLKIQLNVSSWPIHTSYQTKQLGYKKMIFLWTADILKKYRQNIYYSLHHFAIQKHPPVTITWQQQSSIGIQLTEWGPAVTNHKLKKCF